MTIFDLMTSTQLVAYWETLTQDEAPYPAEELFPDDKKNGLSLQWIKGSRGLPVVLKTSAFDVYAVPRPRIGFEKLTAEMPYFKESTYIDEELRQELNTVLATGIQSFIDSVMNRVFDDETNLLRGARASRERMRMMALTTGYVSMANNGQTFTYDYNVTHKVNAAVSWSDHANADPLEDLRVNKELIQDQTGAEVTRAMCNGVTWRHLRNNEKIQKQIFVLTNGVGAVSDSRLRQFIKDELDLDVVINDKRYTDESGNTVKFMPDNTFVMFPAGDLGKTWFGTTPAESDLITSAAANVSITDTGVAVTTIQKADPVQVETIVSMICLPSFEMADQVVILDTNASAGNGGN